MANYRKIYETYTNKKVPKGYEIHHIDRNRDNNDIYNLVMLPIKLHKKYHLLANEIEIYKYEIQINLIGYCERGNAINNYIKNNQIPKQIEFINIFEECKNYIAYRDYLLGKFPLMPYTEKIKMEVEDADI